MILFFFFIILSFSFTVFSLPFSSSFFPSPLALLFSFFSSFLGRKKKKKEEKRKKKLSRKKRKKSAKKRSFLFFRKEKKKEKRSRIEKKRQKCTAKGFAWMGVRDLWNRDRILRGIVDGDRRTRVFGKSIVYPPDLETSFHSSWKLPRGESPYMTILCTTKTLHGSCMFFLKKKKIQKIFYALSGLFFWNNP